MVHFKSILDPLWSAGDMASLRSRFPWVILVLSPFERFYEMDPALDELSAGTSQLIIWRPDRPSVEESARLRVSSLVKSPGYGESAGKYSDPALAGKGIRQLLTTLYVQRGTLITQGIRHSISQTMGNLSLSRYLADILSTRSATVAIKKEMALEEAENLALRWGGLLCRQREGACLDHYDGESQVLAWADRYLEGADGIPLGRPHALPEQFLTTRFRDEVKSFYAAVTRIQHIMRALRRGEISFAPAMVQISQVFGRDESRLLRWKSLAEDLPEWLGWLSGFERSYSYLSASFPTSHAGLERLRGELLASCAEPHRFLDVRERNSFDSNFESFKSSYTDIYVAAHEDTVHIVSNPERMKTRLDPIALRNLEQLSELNPVGKKFLSQIGAIGKFVQANQCGLPVREILSRQPRCYCSFNPSASRLLVRSIDRMNRILQVGIDDFRATLRQSRKAIIQELQRMGVQDDRSRPIAALLSRGPMIALERPALEVLRAILHKHPEILPAADTRPPGAGSARWSQWTAV